MGLNFKSLLAAEAPWPGLSPGRVFGAGEDTTALILVSNPPCGSCGVLLVPDPTQTPQSSSGRDLWVFFGVTRLSFVKPSKAGTVPSPPRVTFVHPCSSPPAPQFSLRERVVTPGRIPISSSSSLIPKRTEMKSWGQERRSQGSAGWILSLQGPKTHPEVALGDIQWWPWQCWNGWIHDLRGVSNLKLSASVICSRTEPHQDLPGAGSHLGAPLETSGKDTGFSSRCPGFLQDEQHPDQSQALSQPLSQLQAHPMDLELCGAGRMEIQGKLQSLSRLGLPTAPSPVGQHNPDPAVLPAWSGGWEPGTPSRGTPEVQIRLWNPQTPIPGFFPSPGTLLEFLSTPLCKPVSLRFLRAPF